MSVSSVGQSSGVNQAQVLQKLQAAKAATSKSGATVKKVDGDGDHDGDTAGSDKGGLDVNG